MDSSVCVAADDLRDSLAAGPGFWFIFVEPLPASFGFSVAAESAALRCSLIVEGPALAALLGLEEPELFLDELRSALPRSLELAGTGTADPSVEVADVFSVPAGPWAALPARCPLSRPPRAGRPPLRAGGKGVLKTAVGT